MIDSCSPAANALLSLEQALERIRSAINSVPGSEKVTLKNALGRILAQSVYAPVNLPPDRNAAMDGYAFSSADINREHPFTLGLAGTSWAGKPFQGQLQAGQCVRIFTGAVVPEQADSVIMQEQVQADEHIIRFPANTPAGQNIRAAGEDVNRGDLLCAHPKKLTAGDIGLLASAGIHDIAVKRHLKIAFFSTGDELTPLGQALEPGKIYDSNRYSLSGLLADPNYDTVDLGVIPDNKQVLENQLVTASKTYDVIITTGGASVGEADYVKDILDSCGQVNFWKVAIKPGKPLAFGKIGSCWFFGLPGNPVAVITTFQQIVAPALRQLCGAPACKPLRLIATCTTALKKAPGRQEFLCGILTQTGSGEFYVASSGKQGSHMLSSISRANCYIVLAPECTSIRTGGTVTVEPFTLFI
ncbi:Molybdopterin molybdenumtransferase [Candidatus Methylobacter favarea]|uniref:Molybdopterin molybdenumtransferase n=1 Tax=Candidatus Methylobacter favarea TaxID=2707345 RepID=A0A8S0X6U1_9GAMM|nr:gephyrin-like molybdotransferase Glp [Candidatus Methylobacter favarea]CAA9889525.1 Molybdopterin molybdenumtransferase [Candidatus Methylobacter favarea]